MTERLPTYSNFLKYYAWCFLIFHVVRLINGLSLSQMNQPIIHEVRQDPLVWNLIYSGIPDLFASSFELSLMMDIIITIPIILILFFKLAQKGIRKVILAHVILFAFYLLIIFSFPSLSIRKYLGLAVVPLVFLFQKEATYERAIHLLRYYVLFIFSSSALWKVTRGSIFESDQFVNILRNQHLEHIVLFPDHITTHIAAGLINQPSLAFMFYIMIALLQISFLIGFLTRKYDKLLLMGFLLFILGDFLVMRVEYWEFFVFIPVFFLSKAKS